MGSLLYLIIWAAFGFWGYKVMESKNRNTGVGIALGVLLGIIGVIICYMHSAKPAPSNGTEDKTPKL